MFKWYKSGIFEKVIPQIRSSGIDLRLSGIVGIDTNVSQYFSDSRGLERSNYRDQSVPSLSNLSIHLIVIPLTVTKVCPINRFFIMTII